MLVRKRNGELQEFDNKKIYNAMKAAVLDKYNELDSGTDNILKRITKEIKSENKDKEIIDIEDIQDMVENKLMGSRLKEVAREYIRYRYKKEVARNYKNDFIKAIGNKLQANNIENQNANVDEKSFGGRVGEASRLLTKQYALDHCMSEMARSNHENNLIYIHDLDSYAVGMHNCLTLPIDKLLEKGFNTRQTDVRPANSVNTAFQLVAVLFQLQSLQQFGGVSASHLDWSMVPYVRKSFFKHYNDGMNFIYKGDIAPDFIDNTMPIDDKLYKSIPEVYEYAYAMTVKEIKQAVEGMYHNLNTLQSRSGNQLPFTSINYGTCTLLEGRLITKALLEVSIEGIGALHRTSIFPCGIFQVMKGVNKEPGTPNYDLFKLALKSTAKRLYPNYCNVDWSTNAGYDKNDPSTYVSTMGKCKLQLI